MNILFLFYLWADTWFSMHCSQNVCKQVKHFGSLNNSLDKKKTKERKKKKIQSILSDKQIFSFSFFLLYEVVHTKHILQVKY